jgi:hypothetical protein
MRGNIDPKRAAIAPQGFDDFVVGHCHDEPFEIAGLLRLPKKQPGLDGAEAKTNQCFLGRGRIHGKRANGHQIV